MDKLIESLVNLPTDRKIEITIALLNDLGVDRVGSRYKGDGYESVLFFNQNDSENILFEFVTRLKY